MENYSKFHDKAYIYGLTQDPITKEYISVMHHMEDGNLQNDEYSDKRQKFRGECPTCNRYNTSSAWCQLCDPRLLTEGWTSGNETLDELIKSTQLK